MGFHPRHLLQLLLKPPDDVPKIRMLAFRESPFGHPLERVRDILAVGEDVYRSRRFG